MHDLMITYEVGKQRMQEFIEQAARRRVERIPEPGEIFLGRVTPELADEKYTCSTHISCTASP